MQLTLEDQQALAEHLSLPKDATPQVLIAEGLCWLAVTGDSVNITHNTEREYHWKIEGSAAGRRFWGNSDHLLEAVFHAVNNFPPFAVMCKSLGIYPKD